jgi:transposase-like protein
MLRWYEEHGRKASLTCRRFGVSRDAFYRWRGRLEASGPGGLEDASHRPQKVRTPTWSKELENTVLELRRLTPGWGRTSSAHSCTTRIGNARPRWSGAF